MSIEIKISGMSTVSGSLAGAIEAMTPRAQRANFRGLVRFGVAEAMRSTPGSGKLRSGWDSEQGFKITKDGFVFRARIFNNLSRELLWYRSALTGKRMPKLDANNRQQKYGDIIPILDRGSKPHFIYPRRYKVLAFKVKGGGTVVTRKVAHPGTKAYRTLRNPREKLANLARAAVVELGEQIIKPY